MLGAIVFILLPHHIGLINAGHNTKLRAIMIAPAVATSFMYFLRRKSLFSIVALIITLALQVRSSHYQIVYYTGILLLFLGLPTLINYLREKQWKTLGSQLGLLVIAVGLAAVIAAPGLILTKQYLPYSIRGGHGETQNTTKSGLNKDYATQWSFPPEEMVTFVMPNFFGGSSQYNYTGNAVPQVKGRKVPGYWGQMPFTSTTEYLGILTVILALFGMITAWKSSMVKSLVGLSVLTLLVSFGRHFHPVFDLFFNYMPLFNKFRVPSMILYLLEIAIPVLAAYGLDQLLHIHKEVLAKYLKIFAGIAGGLLLLSIIPIFFGSGFSLMKASEASQYQPQVLQLIKNVRLDMMKTDAWRLLIFVVLFGGAIFAFIRNMIAGRVLVGILGILLLVDMYTIDHRYLRDFVTQHQNQNSIQKTQIDDFILRDTGLYRVFPVGNGLFGNNRWSYYHQSVGGYHAAKMFNYQKMIEENLYSGTEKGNPINWNIVDLLNVKYLISQQQIQSEHLRPVGQDPATKLLLYAVEHPFPRAWMVYNEQVIPEVDNQRAFLNRADFEPATEAIVSKPLIEQSGMDSVSNSVSVSHFDANHIQIKVNTPRQGLLVISENYLPIWWHGYLDGDPVDINKVNSFQRGVVIPAGTHTVDLRLEARLFHASVVSANVVVWIGQILLLILLLTFLPVPVIQRMIRRNPRE